MVEEQEHAPARAYVWNLVAIMHAARGRWGDAVAHNDRALELFAAVGDYNLESELWQTRSALELCRGTLAGAERAWTRTRELAERTGSPVNLCWSRLDEAQTQLARGRTDLGVQALEQALAIPIFNSDGGTVIERHATTALARLDQGRHAEAVREADAVLDMITRGLPTGWVWGEFGVLAVEVLLELRMAPDPDVPTSGLDRRIRRGLLALRRLSLTFGGIRTRVLILRAGAAQVAGNRRAAERHLAAAHAACRREDQRLDQARVEILRAQLSDDRRRRAELLSGPMEVLAELEQERERRRAEAILS
jgi:tetratricopeptide (TPR) repeat protein